MLRQQSRLGVVGYCPPTKFDENEAKKNIVEGYNQFDLDFPSREIVVVSGLTSVGVLKLAYEEAKRRGWKTAGVACKQAYAFKNNWFPVDEEPIIIGDNWGDESLAFVSSIDALVRIGVGKQSIREAEFVKKQGKRTYEYNLPTLK